MSHSYDRIVADNLARAQERIAAAAAKANRRPEDISLIAVSKNHPREAVLAALAAGQRHFGENRVQEAQGKFTDAAVKAASPFLHIIGPIQTNKLRDALGVAQAIDTLDRPRLLEAMAPHLLDHSPRLLIQINIDDEPQKAGVTPADADAFIAQCRERCGDRLQGLMCIPDPAANPLRAFAWLAECAQRNSLPVLSMGMSGDYEAAIACGATEIRLGTAIFGERDYSQC